MSEFAAVAALRPILDHWKTLRPLPDLSVDDQFSYTEEVCAVTLWIHSTELIRELARPGGEPLDAVLFGLGTAMARLGDPAGAAEVLSRAAEGIAAGVRPLAAVRVLNALGSAYFDLDEFGRAEDSYRRALALILARDPNTPKLAILQNNLATCLSVTGRYDEAEHYYLESIRVLEHSDDAELVDSASWLGAGVSRADLIGVRLHNLGEVHLQRSREADGPKEARELLMTADQRFSEALTYYQHLDYRVNTRVFRAEVAVLAGRGPEADATLAELEMIALQDPVLHHQLPGIYRRRALASRSVGALYDALRHCRRALTTSLVHADRPEEKKIVDTFVDTMAAAHRRDPGIDVRDQGAAARMAREFHDRYGDVVDDLIAFLERKDWYTGRAHSRSVANVSKRVAEAVLSENPSAAIDLDVISLSAMLHDVGKLRVPWALLNKILPVRKDEFVILKRHAIEGYNILNAIGLGPLAEIAGEHHETVDGRGYPFGKTNPTLMGNIIALADAFEAMTTINRRWRPAKKKNEAVAELVGLEGKWFYPEVARGVKKALG